jgi:hypothetical protein
MTEKNALNFKKGLHAAIVCGWLNDARYAQLSRWCHTRNDDTDAQAFARKVALLILGFVPKRVAPRSRAVAPGYSDAEFLP